MTTTCRRGTIGRGLLVLVVLVLGALVSGCGGDEGTDLYASECARCHGSDRAGLKGVGPDLREASFAMEESDQWLAERIRNGYHNMPRFTPTLTDGQIGALISFLRSGGETPSPTAVVTTTSMPDDEVLALGKLIFDVEAGDEGKGCAGCHAADARGTTDGPSILGASKWGIADALGSVADMADIELSPTELEAVYRYLEFLTEGR